MMAVSTVSKVPQQILNYSARKTVSSRYQMISLICGINKDMRDKRDRERQRDIYIERDRKKSVCHRGRSEVDWGHRWWETHQIGVGTLYD